MGNKMGNKIGNNRSSQRFDSAVALLNMLSTDLKYNCLIFLDKDSYYAMTKVLEIQLKIKIYYLRCEGSLLSNYYERYMYLCKSFSIPLKENINEIREKINHAYWSDRIEYTKLIKLYPYCHGKNEAHELASQNGHVEVIRYLRSIGSQNESYELASQNEHLEII